MKMMMKMKSKMLVLSALVMLCAGTAMAAYRSSLGVSSGYDFFSYGDKGWYVSDGAMRSGTSLADNQSSSLVTCIKGPAILVFDWKTASESGYDKLHLYDNGTSKDNISGVMASWATKTYVIGEGMHVIRWTYSKDTSNAVSSDCGWVRNVGIVTTSPTTLLPNGYRLLDYIYTEGASYLDTGYTHTASTWVLGDFYVYTSAASSYATTGQKWGCLFGARNGDYKKNSMAFFSRDYNSKSRYCRTGNEHQFSYPGVGYWQIVCTGKNCYLGNGNNAFALHTSSGTADGGTCPMFIGDVNKSTTAGGKTAEGSRVQMDVNHFTILSSENVAARNMIPCKNSSGTAGLYDSVNGGFHKSETTTGFTAYGTYYLVQCNADGGTFPDGSTSVYVWVRSGAAMPRIPMLSSRTGYEFQGFYTSANRMGTRYYNPDGTSARSCDLTSDTTLYAGWAGNCYAVTLDAQGGAGGSASVTATYGAAMPTATMPTKARYTFRGYFDAAEGGKQYYDADGKSVANWDKAAATTLYAQWTLKNYTLTLDLAGGTGVGSASVTWGQIPAKIAVPIKEDAKFLGFFTESDGKGTLVFDEYGIATEPWQIDEDATLYAYWINELCVSDPLGLSFDIRAVKPAKMGRAEVLTSSPSVWTDDEGLAQILAAIGEGTPVVVIDEVTADSSLWTPSELGLYTLTHTLAGNVKETAKFLVEGFSYAVTFDANGGTGEMSGTTLEYDAEGTAPECAYTRDGYVFESWNTKVDGTGEKILSNGTYRNLVTKEGDIGVLYAQWAVDTEKAIAYEIDVTPDADPTTPQPKPIKVPTAWITENLPDVDPTEPEKVKEAMDKPNPKTGLKPWQAYVLGVGKNEKEAQVWTASPQVAEKDTIKIVGKEYKPTKNTGFSVKYRLDTELKGQLKEKGNLAASPAFNIDLAGDNDPSGLYTVNVVFVPDNDEDGAETVESMNTVGILKVPSPKTLEIVGVPWEELAPSNGAPITVANLVKKATLTDGDKLHVYDRTAKNYKSYLYHAAEQSWEALGVYKITAMGLEKVGGAPENAEQVARGSAVWLERKDVSKPFYLYGQYNSNAVETKIEKNRHNLVACPKMEPFHLNGKDANGANKISGTINANDQIMIPGVNDNPPKLYSYKSGKGWGYNTIPAGSRRLTFVTTDDEVPAGTGFWYISKGGTPTIKW